MTPIEFPEQNVVLGKNQPQYLPLPVYRVDEKEGRVISCWQLSEREVELISRTGKLWVAQMTYNAAPMPLALHVDKAEIFTDGVNEFIDRKEQLLHKTKIYFDFWDRVKILLGASITYESNILIDRPCKVVSGNQSEITVGSLLNWFRRRFPKPNTECYINVNNND